MCAVDVLPTRQVLPATENLWCLVEGAQISGPFPTPFSRRESHCLHVFHISYNNLKMIKQDLRCGIAL